MKEVKLKIRFNPDECLPSGVALGVVLDETLRMLNTVGFTIDLRNGDSLT